MKAVTLLSIGAIVATGAIHAGAAQGDTTVTRTLRFSGSGERTVDIRAITGSIQVIGYDGNDVQLEARRTIDADTDAARKAAEQEKEVTLNFEDGTSRVGATVREPGLGVCGERNEGRRDWWRRGYRIRFDFTVRVPRDARLRLCTISGGDIRVEGTSGDFDVSNVNGRVTMTGIRGSGSATTVNGAVSVTFVDSPRTASSFRTVNGEIDVTFPASLAADFTMKTMHGDLLTDFDVQILPLSAGAAERRDGRNVYRSRGFTRVRVGRGGPEIALETLNGDVRIRRATR